MQTEKSTTFYKFILALCLLCSILVTVNYGVYSSYNSDIERQTGVSIYGYLIKPNIPLYLFIFAIFVGTYFPAVTGIALLRVRRSWRQKLKAAHLLASVMGFLCTAVGTCLDVMTMGDIRDVKCSYTPYYTCYCGAADQPYFTSMIVCNMFPVRIIYAVCIILACICTSVCFVLITCWAHKKQERPPALKKNQVSQDSQVVPEDMKPYHTRVSSAMGFTEYITKQHDLMLV